MRRTIVLGLMLAGGLILAACTQGLNGTPIEPGQATVTAAPLVTVTVTAAPPATETTTVAPPPSTRQAAPPSSTKVASPSEASSDDQIRTDAANAFDVVNTYWERLFATWKDPQGGPIYWQRPALYRGDGFYDSARGEDFFCAGDPLGPQNAAFCGSPAAGTGTVAWDMNLFREQEAGHGNAPVYWTIAHEMGHAAQTRFRHDDQGGAAPPMSDTVHAEQQADCLSGATLAKAEQDGYLTDSAGTGVDGIIGFISELENQNGGDHGSAADRMHAFLHGHDTGDVESCLYNRGVPPPGLFE